jgi:hypothetical protein
MVLNITKKVIILSILLVCVNLWGADPKIQAIHGMADPELVSVNMKAFVKYTGVPIQEYQDESLIDIPFRSGSGTISVPYYVFSIIPLEYVQFEIFKSSGESVWKSNNIELKSDKTYIGIISGVINPPQFAPNPNGIDIGINVNINDKARDNVQIPGNVEFFMFNAVTDAPALKLKIKDGVSLVDSIMYRIHYSNYVSLPPTTHIFEVLDSAKDSVLYTYSADLSPYSGRTFVLYATGFLDTLENQNGEKFALHALFSDGTIVGFEEYQPVKIVSDFPEGILREYALKQNYPNPFNPSTTIEFILPESEQVELSIFNTSGQKISTLIDQKLNAGSHSVQWNAENYASGVYFYSIRTKNFTQTKKLMFLR